MIEKYSKLKFQDRKLGFTTEDASFTHYLHSYGTTEAKYFERKATPILEALTSEYRQVKLPIEFDVPLPPPEEPQFSFIDLFAGIGGFRIAFQELNGKCVFSSEWDKFSQKTYEANFGEVPFGDITKINEKEIPEHDILVAGFPCQPFSIAGVSKKNSLGRAHGFKDETQGTLFFDIKRIIKEKRPKAFLLENVKNLVSHDKGNTFKVIHKTLKKLRYNIHFQVLDGKYFVPQHRERIVIVGFDMERYGTNDRFQFPEMPDQTLAIEEILEPNPDPKYTLSDKLWKYLQDYSAKHKAKGNGFGFGLVQLDGIARTLSARYYKDGSEVLIPQDGQNPRRLTPRECARLQGFPDKFEIPVSDTQAYKQFGNSVVSPLMKSVGFNIVKELAKLDEHIRESHTISATI